MLQFAETPTEKSRRKIMVGLIVSESWLSGRLLLITMKFYFLELNLSLDPNAPGRSIVVL